MISRFNTPSTAMALACMLAAPVLAAESVSVQCTIKAVAPPTRSITVGYKVGATDKSITLDVSRKAEITLNGQPSDLESLGAGMTATVEYQKELAVVTKITATGKKAVANSTRPVLRLTLQLSEFGDGVIRLEKTSEIPADDFVGQPFTFSRLPRTKATKGEDGMFRLIHDFSDPDELDAIASVKAKVAIDKDKGLLVLGAPPPQNSSAQGMATLQYGNGMGFRTPTTLTCDLLQYGGGLFVMALGNNQVGMLQCRMTSKGRGVESPFDVQIAWLRFSERQGQNPVLETLTEAKNVTPIQPYEQRFRCPLPNARIDEPFWVSLNGDNLPKTVTRLEFRGRLTSSLGIDLDETQGMIFAKRVVPNRLAEKAGIQQGDVISAINADRPKSKTDAAALLNRLPIGQEAVITVQRGGKNLEFRVQAE